jgi:hypothetical protein
MPSAKTPWEQASEWFGRTLAIVILMVAPGAAGAWLDSQFGTGFLTVFGFGLGMVLAITMLIVYTKIRPPVGDRPPISSGGTRSVTARKASIDNPANKLPPSDMPLPKVPGAESLERPDDR